MKGDLGLGILGGHSTLVERNVDLVLQAMIVGVHGVEAFFLDRVALGHCAPFLLRGGVNVDGLPRGLSATAEPEESDDLVVSSDDDDDDGNNYNVDDNVDKDVFFRAALDIQNRTS